jgi:cation transport regulator ChaB
MIEESGYNLEDDIPSDIQDRIRDKETESLKKVYQEHKLQLIKAEEEYKTKSDRRTKEKSEKDTKK